MNRCPEHPDKDTMVPCMECGRYFCRICKPPRGAGQLCQVCYDKSVSRLEERAEPEAAEKKRFTFKFGKEARGEGHGKKHDYRGRLKEIGRKLLDSTVAAARFLMAHFPIALSKKEKTGGTMPPLLRSWYKLLIVIFTGTLFWVMATAIIQRRTGLISIITALIVAIGVILAFGGRMDLEVAVIAASITLLVLGMGEVIVYALYRGGMIERLNIVGATLADIDDPFRYFRAYTYDLIIMRILPGCIVAFTVALWPFSRQLTWAGFKQH